MAGRGPLTAHYGSLHAALPGDLLPRFPAGQSQLISARARYALYAAILLATACALDGRLRFVAALPFAAAAFVACCAAMFIRGEAPSIEWHRRTFPALAAMAALTPVIPGPAGELWFTVVRKGCAVLGVVAVLMAASDSGVRRRRGVTVAVISATVLAFLTPLGTPRTMIDVVTWTEAAIRALMEGIHPYTVQAADVYGGTRDFGFTVQVYPYMPATLLALTPFEAVSGDFRFALAACLPLTVWLLRATGARAGADPRFVDAATLALVLHPQAARIVSSGWTEPLIVLAAAAFAWLAAGRTRPTVRAAVFFLQAAFKQYLVAPVVLYVCMCAAPRRWRAVLAGVAVAVVTIGPFLVWDAAATANGMLFQVRAPSRPRFTAVSLAGLLVNLNLAYPPMWVSMAAQAVVGAVAYIRLHDRGAGGLLLASATALLATFLVGWQAFVNYYYYIGSLLLIAAVLLAAPRTTPV